MTTPTDEEAIERIGDQAYTLRDLQFNIDKIDQLRLENARYKFALEHISKKSPRGYLGRIAREALEEPAKKP